MLKIAGAKVALDLAEVCRYSTSDLVHACESSRNGGKKPIDRAVDRSPEGPLNRPPPFFKWLPGWQPKIDKVGQQKGPATYRMPLLAQY